MLSAINRHSSKDLEAQSLITHAVVPLRLADTWKASKTSFDAFLDDPMALYLRVDEKPHPGANRAATMMRLALWIRTKIVLTVNGGAAFIVMTPVQTGSTPPMEEFAELIVKWTATAMDQLKTEEQKKRIKEADEKIQKLTSLVLGDQVKEMIYIGGLATEPQSQGQGFGSALLEAVTGYADSVGQSTWLGSSNILNTSFYNSHGFKTVGEAYLGDDNPEWHQDPVIIRLMVRESKKQPLPLEKPHSPFIPGVP